MKRFYMTSRVTVAAALLIASAGARLSAADDMPKAETILDKYIEVTGGKAAFEKVHSEVSTGSMEIRGMKGAATTYRMAPDKNYTEIKFEGIGTMQEGSNGTLAWSNSAIQGPHLKEGEEKETSLLRGRFDAETNWRNQYSKVETVGSETVDGKDCWKVEATPKVGSKVTRYYDKKTGPLVKTQMTVKSAMGEVAVESIADDYRKEGDLLVPHKLTNRAAGQEFTITIDSVKYNVDIPATTFEPPAEVKALLKK